LDEFGKIGKFYSTMTIEQLVHF